MQFQRDQVEKFCAKYNLSSPLKLTNSHTVHRHLLLYRDAQTLLCFTPKVIPYLCNVYMHACMYI